MTSLFSHADYSITPKMLRDWETPAEREQRENKIERITHITLGMIYGVVLVVAIYIGLLATVTLLNVEEQFVAQQKIAAAELHYSVTNNK